MPGVGQVLSQLAVNRAGSGAIRRARGPESAVVLRLAEALVDATLRCGATIGLESKWRIFSKIILKRSKRIKQL